MKKQFIILIIITINIISTLLYSEDYYNMKKRYLSEQSFKTAYYYFNNMKYAAAIDFFRKSLMYYPRNDKTLYWLGKAYLLSGYTDKAIASWEQLKVLKQNDVFIDNQLSRLLTKDVVSSFENKASLRYTFLSSLNISGNPVRVDFDANGRFYVLNYTGNLISIYNSSLQYIKSIHNNLIKPFDISFFDDFMFVSYFGSDKIKMFDKTTYKELFEIGGFGFQNGRFAGPTGITIDNQKLYVVDQGNNRVQIFQIFPKPYFIGKFGVKGSGSGEFDQATDVAIYNNKIWVSDKGNERVEIFDLSGNFLEQIHDSNTKNINELFTHNNFLYAVSEDKGLLRFNPEEQVFSLIKKPGQGLEKIQSAVIDTTDTVFFSEFTNPTVVSYTLERNKLNSFNLDTLFISNNAYPKIIFKSRVKDIEGKDIKGLTKSNFKLQVNGKPINDFSVSAVKPQQNKLSLTILLNTSISMRKNQEKLDSYIKQILPNFNNADQIKMISYNEQAKTIFNFTYKKELVKKTFNNVDWVKTSSQLYGDILDKTLYNSIQSGISNDSHNAILLITDGSESLSFKHYTPEIISNFALQMGVPLYVLMFQDKRFNTISSIFKLMAERSGGGYLNFYKTNEIYNIINTIRMNATTFYVFSYNVKQSLEGETNKGKWQNIRINLDYRGLYGRDQLGFYIPE